MTFWVTLASTSSRTGLFLPRFPAFSTLETFFSVTFFVLDLGNSAVGSSVLELEVKLESDDKQKQKR